MTSTRKCSIYVCSWRIDVRRVANRQPFVGLFATRVVRSNAVLSKETMDAESSEVLGMWEGEFGEGRDSESGESGVVTYSISKKPHMVELHCSCRMPEEKGDEMAECDFCNVWYHCYCMDILSEVFGE